MGLIDIAEVYYRTLQFQSIGWSIPVALKLK